MCLLLLALNLSSGDVCLHFVQVRIEKCSTGDFRVQGAGKDQPPFLLEWKKNGGRNRIFLPPFSSFLCVLSEGKRCRFFYVSSEGYCKNLYVIIKIVTVKAFIIYLIVVISVVVISVVVISIVIVLV